MRLERSTHLQSYELQPRSDVSEDVQPGAGDAGRLIDLIVCDRGKRWQRWRGVKKEKLITISGAGGLFVKFGSSSQQTTV